MTHFQSEASSQGPHGEQEKLEMATATSQEVCSYPLKHVTIYRLLRVLKDAETGNSCIILLKFYSLN